MTTKMNTGGFVWHDLMTTHVRAARAFYSELFGWRMRDIHMGPMGTHTMISVNGRDIGGLVGLNPADKIASHWVGYLTVPNVDLATQTALASGGSVPLAGTEIPSVGRYAVIGDPQGAAVCAFTGKNPPQPDLDGPPTFGSFCWDELSTPNPKAAAGFYRELTGWSLEERSPPDGRVYYLFKRGKHRAAGMTQATSSSASSWLTFVAVNDVGDATARALRLGGSMQLAPDVLPSLGRFSVLLDPTGAAFALLQAGEEG